MAISTNTVVHIRAALPPLENSFAESAAYPPGPVTWKQHLAGDVVDALERRGVGPRLGQVGRSDSGRALVDGNRRGGVRRPEPLGFGYDLGRLGVLRQPGRHVVFLNAVDLSGQRAEDQEQDDPDGQNDPFSSPSTRKGR